MRVRYAGSSTRASPRDTASLSVAVPVLDGYDLRAQQPHAVDVERLPRGVLLAHEDLALHAHQCRGRGRRDAVLSGPGLGDERVFCPYACASSA